MSSRWRRRESSAGEFPLSSWGDAGEAQPLGKSWQAR